MNTSDGQHCFVLVPGAGDIGSAIAVLLFKAGYAVALHDEPAPATSRCGMAFTDAVFEGVAVLEGVVARRVDCALDLDEMLTARTVVPVTTMQFPDALKATNWSVLVDARLRKRNVPEHQRGLAPLTVGLGPNFVAGETVDLAVETGWGEHLGEIIRSGTALPLAGGPPCLGGIGRERFVYAPVAGCFETAAHIGDHVAASQTIATIADIALSAPLSGVIHGLTHSGIAVAVDAKVIEVDPRDDPAAVFGLGERPRFMAEGVRKALEDAELCEPPIDRPISPERRLA
jgi:xanthine dehydrogenase accessory factor